MHGPGRRFRFLALAVCLFAAPGITRASGTVDVPTGTGDVFLVRIASILHPIARDLLVETLDRADREGAAAVVVELDTPGGLLTSTREMTTAMLGARTPVVVWVAPSGAQAASAGFFLLMAGDFAAMAPSTNTGAAHPVGGQGETIEGVLGKKIEEDSAANIRALASRRGRDVALAERAVLESKSFTAEEALAAGLVDLVAADETALLAGLDGRTYEKPQGEKRTLHVAAGRVRHFEMNAVQRFLSALLHPNIAYLLMTLGMLGLYFELAHPGAVFPGVLGGISLLLGLYALSVLPVRFAGVALIVLGLGMLIAEIKVPSYGLLTVGGLTSFVLGSLILFRSPEPALKLSLGIVATVAGFFLAVTVFLLVMAARNARLRVTTGREGLLGERAVVRVRLAPDGKVYLMGEWWNAISETPVEVGEEVEVTAVEGMLLRVRPLPGSRS
jgi:membrane-bound serine protease (ClpP class)